MNEQQHEDILVSIQSISSKIERFCERKEERERKSFSLNELFTSLAKAQAEMETAGLTSANPFFKSKYADLAEIVKASRPALTKHGLAVIQYIESNQLISMLGHSSGQYITSIMPINPVKADVQSLGSYITYLRRYSYAALVGVVVGGEDDDGNQAVAHKTAAPKYITAETVDKLYQAFADYQSTQDALQDKFGITDWADLLLKDLDEVSKEYKRVSKK